MHGGEEQARAQKHGESLFRSLAGNNVLSIRALFGRRLLLVEEVLKKKPIDDVTKRNSSSQGKQTPSPVQKKNAPCRA